ncbi:MAG: glycosyltransferase [Oscillospiraceae bacterium]|nr:glycosyltransferase [Oscillospiraceae bacterium]
MSRKRIAFFQEDLGPGGIQKSLFNLLRNLDYSRVDATLFLFEEGCFFEGELPPELQIRVLPKPPSFCRFLPFDFAEKLWKVNWEQYGEFDLAADFNSYQFSCAAGTLGVKAGKRVLWIHNDVEIKLRNEWKYRVLWHFFHGKQKRFDAFIPCSAALIEPFKRASGQTEKEYRVIANYIDVSEIRRKQTEEAELPECFHPDAVNFTALGRLCHQKGYDIMIRLFAAACRDRKDLHLYIIGDGPDREALEAQAEREAAGQIHFLGARSNPYAVMSRMDAFLSTSRYEGQPLNIEEARVIGLPLYCSKNLEAYSEGLTGFNEDELIRAISRAQKQPKQPDDLLDYNRRILESIYRLAE